MPTHGLKTIPRNTSLARDAACWPRVVRLNCNPRVTKHSWHSWHFLARSIHALGNSPLRLSSPRAQFQLHPCDPVFPQRVLHPHPPSLCPAHQPCIQPSEQPPPTHTTTAVHALLGRQNSLPPQPRLPHNTRTQKTAQVKSTSPALY